MLTRPNRWDPASGPSSRVAVVLPGSGYSPSHPLLEFGRQALVQHGWSVQQVWWEPPDDVQDLDAASVWVRQQAAAALDAEAGAGRVLVLAKSLGTLAAPVAADRGLDAIWLTPLLAIAANGEAIGADDATGAHQLVVGGTSDPRWDSAVAHDLACRGNGVEVLEIDGADHSLLVPGDTVRSVEVQLRVSCAVDAFLAHLARSAPPRDASAPGPTGPC